MSKEPTSIDRNIFQKEIRYKIMAKFLKRKNLTGDIETLFGALNMDKPIAIMGVRKKINLINFIEELEEVKKRGYLKREDDTWSITSSGEEYAKAPKGESSWYNY